MGLLRGFLDSVIDTLLPPPRRSARTKTRTASDLPIIPETHDILGTTVTTLFHYHAPAVEDAIRALKYEHSGHAAHIIAEALADYLREEVATMQTFSPAPIVLAPVPLYPARERERGFNQITRILDSLPDDLRTLARPHLLARTRATVQQTRLSRTERLSNVAGAFALADTSLSPGTRVILIDDVTTTGATLANAANPLRRAGLDVTLLALARA
jgi:ComF family protein